jgi:hypothetical protein
MGTYTGIVNAVNQNAIYSGLDAHKPEVYSKIYRKYGKQFAEFLNTCRMMGRGEGALPISQESFKAFEKEWEHETFIVGGNSGASAPGGTQTITIDITSIDSSDRIYPRKGFLVMYPDETQGRINEVASNGTTITVQAGVGDVLPAITTSDELMIGGSVFAEYTGQPDGVTQNYTDYDYYLQILKENATISGTEMTNDYWFEVYNDDGEVAGVWTDATRTAENDIDIAIENQLFWGSGLAYTDESGNSAQTTKGMIPTIRDRGLVAASDPASFDYNDLEDYDAYMVSQGNTSPYMSAMVGRDLYTGISNELREEFNTSGVDITSMFSDLNDSDREARMVQANFNAINLNNRSWAFKRVNTWSNPKTTGATGYDMSKYGIIAPVNTFQDAKSGDMLPNFAIMHKEKSGYSRAREVWKIAGAGGDTGNYNSEIDGVRLNIRSHVGLFFPEANNAVLLDPNYTP